MGLHFNSEVNRFRVRFQYRGLGNEDPSWEPCTVIKEDIPEMMELFIQYFQNQELVQFEFLVDRRLAIFVGGQLNNQQQARRTASSVLDLAL